MLIMQARKRRQQSAAGILNLDNYLPLGSKKAAKVYAITCHPLLPHVVAIGANAGASPADSMPQQKATALPFHPSSSACRTDFAESFRQSGTICELKTRHQHHEPIQYQSSEKSVFLRTPPGYAALALLQTLDMLARLLFIL